MSRRKTENEPLRVPVGEVATAEVELPRRVSTKAGRKPVTALPDREPVLTIQQAFRTQLDSPLVKAFLFSEGILLEYKQLTRAQWDAAFEAFKATPRG